MSQMGPLSTPWSVEETEQDEAVSGRLDELKRDKQSMLMPRDGTIKTTTASVNVLRFPEFASMLPVLEMIFQLIRLKHRH